MHPTKFIVHKVSFTHKTPRADTYDMLSYRDSALTEIFYTRTRCYRREGFFAWSLSRAATLFVPTRELSMPLDTADIWSRKCVAFTVRSVSRARGSPPSDGAAPPRSAAIFARMTSLVHRRDHSGGGALTEAPSRA